MTDRRRYPRSCCCVPFCRRTSTLFKTEWLCGQHWRLVDRRLKAFRTKRLKMISRQWDVAEAKYRLRCEQIAAEADARGIHNADEVWSLMDTRDRILRHWHRAERLIWRRMKAQAIERAATSFI